MWRRLVIITDRCGVSHYMHPDELAHSRDFLVQHDSGAQLSSYIMEDEECRDLLAHPDEICVSPCYLCDRTPMHTKKYNRREFHVLALDSLYNTQNPLSFTGSGITDYVKRNRFLVEFEINGFAFGVTGPHDDVAQFTRAVGESSLQVFSCMEFKPASACTFFDTLPASRLRNIDVIITKMSAEEESAVVASVARFVSDPIRSRSVTVLHVRPLSQEAQFFLKHIVLGSREALGADVQGADTQQPNLSMLCMSYNCTSPSNPAFVLPEWMRHSRYSVGDHGIDKHIYERNSRVCECTQQEAVELLRAARIVGCRACFLGERPGIFPFAKLPGGLRIHILAMLAPHLDRTQVISVLSWACCAATIGHCCRPRPDKRPPMEPVLDVPAWDWDACATSFAHAISLMDRISHHFALPFLECTGTQTPSWNCYM